MVGDYGYINARIKMMRTALLDGRAFEGLLGAQSYPELLRLLSESPLSADLGDATAQGAGLPELDRGLSRNLFESVQKVYRLADGNAKKEIGALLQKWDLLNLKSLVRGLSAGRSAEDTAQSLIPAGTLSPAVLQAAVQGGDLASAASALSLSGHPLASALREGLAAYNASGNLIDLEVALDQAYYRYALRAASGTALRQYLAREIDVSNALTARSLAGQQAAPTLFVSGGRDIDAATFARLQGGDLSNGGEVAPILEAPTLDEAERAARRLLDGAARSAAAGDPLGVGVAIDYLRRKEQEIARLRLLARAKFYGVPAEQIRQEVLQA